MVAVLTWQEHREIMKREAEKWARQMDRLQRKLDTVWDAILQDPPDQRSGAVSRDGFYVYELLDVSGAVVYVGQSSHLMERMKGHKEKVWTQVRFEQLRTFRGMKAWEAARIHARHPKYNKLCPACGPINQEALVA